METDLKNLPTNVKFNDDIDIINKFTDNDLKYDLNVFLFENKLNRLGETISKMSEEMRKQTQIVIVIRNPLNILASSIQFHKPLCPEQYIIDHWGDYYYLSLRKEYLNIPITVFYYDRFHDTKYLREFLNQTGIQSSEMTKPRIYGIKIVNTNGEGSSFYKKNIDLIQNPDNLLIYQKYAENPYIGRAISLYGDILRSRNIWQNLPMIKK